MKTTTMNTNALKDVFEDIEFLTTLFDDMISDLHHVKGGQQARHSYMLYRKYLWEMKADLHKAIENEQ